MQLEKIGTPINGSPRAAHIDADMSRIKKYHSGYIGYTKLVNALRIVSAILLGGAGLAYRYVGLGLAIFLAVVGLLVFFVSRFVDVRKNTVRCFKEGVLMGGIFVEAPNTVIVLAPDISPHGENVVIGIIKEKVETFNFNLSVGDKLTFSAWYGLMNEKAGIFKMVSPDLNMYATDDKEILQACTNAIDDDEWELLHKSIPYISQLEKGVLYVVEESEGTDKLEFIKASDYQQIK